MTDTETIWIFPAELVARQESLYGPLQKSLEKIGMNLEPCNDWKNHSGPGIIYLDKFDNHFLTLVDAASFTGTRRLLVLLAQQAQDYSTFIWKLLQGGASDVLVWRDNQGVEQLVTARFYRWREVDKILNSHLVKGNLIGESSLWKKTLRQIIEAALYTQEPVLLVGQTGTGKELAARLIHTLDKERSKNNLVTVDCTTINLELSGSELFGHERGAFTGAVCARDGAFATAQDGSLFLDEVGELPAALQVQLLRVIQEKTYRRVGSSSWRKVDFRLICATNRDLKNKLEEGSFRSDLYYRIANWTIQLPSLKDRREDILLLADHFLAEVSGNNPSPVIDEEVKQYLLTRAYPGNVRELRNLVYRIYSHCMGTGRILLGDIPPEEWPDWKADAEHLLRDATKMPVRIALEHFINVDWRMLEQIFKNVVFQAALECTHGKTKDASRLLRVNIRTVQGWQKKNHSQKLIPEKRSRVPASPHVEQHMK